MATPNLSSPEGWQAFVNQHGGLAGDPTVVNPTTGTGALAEPVQDPFYRYTFADGSVVEINKAGEIKALEAKAPGASPATNWQLVNDPRTGKPYALQDPTTGAIHELPTLPAASTAAPAPVSAPANEQNIMVRDPKDGTLTAIPNPNYVAPKDPKAVVQLGNAVYERQPDGSYVKVLSGDKAPHIVAGTSSTDKMLIVEDANGNQTQLPNPNYVAPRPTVIGGTSTTDKYITKQNPDGTTSQEPNPNYVAPKPTAVATNTDAQNIVTIDQDGTLHTTPNPNYRPPAPQVVPGFQGGDNLPVMTQDPKSGQWNLGWVPNNGRVMVDAAIYNQFFPALKGLVGDGKGQVPLDVAKDWATQADNMVKNQQQAQRDQDSYVNNQTKTASDYATNLYKDIAPPGLSDDTAAIGQALQNHTAVGPMPVRTMNVPDPTSFMASAVAQALADRSPAAAQQVAGQVPFQGPSAPAVAGQPGAPMAATPDAPLPSYAGGGVVPGPPGLPQMAVVHGGEAIVDPRVTPTSAHGGHSITINIGHAGQPTTTPGMPTFQAPRPVGPPPTMAQGASSYVGGPMPPGLAMLQALGRLPAGAMGGMRPPPTISPPGVPAPAHLLNYTPATGEIHPPGSLAPVNELNVTAYPGGNTSGQIPQGARGGAPMPAFRGPTATAEV